jgi:phytoene synthase
MKEPSHRAKAGYAYCEMVVRRDDPDRWLASLFVPKPRRPPIHALLAFSLEIARVRDMVSEPLLGEIRFQWWRDALDADGHGDVAANQVAVALLDTLERFEVPAADLLALIDARLFDLYEDPMDRVEALETYAKATSSTLFRLAARILNDDHAGTALEAADHAGIAYAVTGLLRSLPWHAAHGKTFVPRDILEKHQASGDFAARRVTPQVLAALAELRQIARGHLESFYSRLFSLPERIRPAFLVTSLCEPYLRQMEKPSYDPFKTLVELPQWRRQWILWRAARRWE